MDNQKTTMQRRKRNETKEFSKIIKTKNEHGELQEKVLGKREHESKTEVEADRKDAPSEEEFEDEFDDEFEQEEGWVSASDEECQEGEQMKAEEKEQREVLKMEEESRKGKGSSSPQTGIILKKKDKVKRIQQQEDQDNMEEEGSNEKKSAFLGSNKQLKKGEVLDFDNSAYDMLHRLNIEWPSLSIDFVYKSSPFEAHPGFQQMTKYPYQVYTVQGSSSQSNSNFVYLTKMTKLHRTKFDDDPDAEENEGEEGDDEPEIFYQQAITNYDINRIRSLGGSPVVAFWNDSGHGGDVHLMDLTVNLEKLKSNISSKKPEAVKEIIIPMDCSGYAINWNPNKIGQLAAGDMEGRVTVLANNENYTSWSKQTTYTYHKASVEDIIFSPDQDFVFASCSSDRTLQIVDMRVNQTQKSQLKINAHDSDVNVGDWNAIAKHLIVTGGDDAMVKVWDLRMCKGKGKDEELLCFNWHTEPITSIGFQPNEESVIAVASEDNRLSIWDMSVENEEADPEVPNELMFLHQGQEEVKEIRYHPVYYEMVISSSLDSVNVFKPSFEMPEEDEDENHDKEDLKRPPIKQEELDKFLGKMSLN